MLTVLNHDVSGRATVLLVENEDTNKAFGVGFGTFLRRHPVCFTFWSTPGAGEATNTHNLAFLRYSRAVWHPF